MRDDRERLLDMLEAAQKIAERVARGRARFDADEDLQIGDVNLSWPHRAGVKTSRSS